MKLNLAMCRVWPESRSQSSYFKLFRLCDRDGSGLMSFYELTKMIREVLRIPAERMGEAHLLSVWRSIDTDCDGTIQAGGVLRFVRKGWDAFQDEQIRLSKMGNDLLRRPNWIHTCGIPMDRPAWREQAMTLAERRKFYLESAHRDVIDRARKFKEQAKRAEAERQMWQSKLVRVVSPTLQKHGSGGSIEPPGGSLAGSSTSLYGRPQSTASPGARPRTVSIGAVRPTSSMSSSSAPALRRGL